MKAFRVTIKRASGLTQFIALGESSAAVHKAAEDRFDEPCGIVVIPLSKVRPC